jgi:hypothetical protein
MEKLPWKTKRKMPCLRILNENLKRCNGNVMKFAFYTTKCRNCALIAGTAPQTKLEDKKQ